jgi:MSHA pilin protein MshC
MVQHPPTTRCRCIESSRNRAGFTLIELVVVIIVVGIVAVVTIPRLNSKTFDTVGFYQEALSSVRYAQKEAVAKRRVVCVSLTGNSITVRFAKAISSFTCDTDLTSPRGVNPFSVTARAGVTLTSAPAIATLYFDPLGRPFDALNSASPQRTLTISGDGNQNFVIEPETGYVH